MDDIVVLILTLLIVVLGAISQIKKKRLVQPDANENNDSGNFWDLLQGESEFVPQQPEFKPPEEPMPAETIQEQPKYKFTPAREGVSDIKKEEVEIYREKS